MEAKKKPSQNSKKAVSNKPAKKTAVKKSIYKNEDADIQKLANRIKAIRKKLGYTNADYFAYEMEITRSQYARYELGQDIRFSTLMKLIKAFGMTPEEFFSEGF